MIKDFAGQTAAAAMIIRQDQMTAFEKAAVGNFIREMAAHCREFSPNLCKTLTPEELDGAIRYGISQAERHGFNQRGPVRLYLDLMIVLGSGFDTDPQYPWAAEILGKREGEQVDRTMKLHSRSATYIEVANGPDDAYSRQALAELKRRLELGLTFHEETLDLELMRLMASIHSPKTAVIGDGSLKLLIAEARMRAQSTYGFRTARSLALTLTLMFAFGHGFDTEPLMPWISRTLERLDPADPDDAAARLERRAVLWMNAVLQNAEVKD